KGGFAASAGAKQADEFSLMQVEGDRLDGGKRFLRCARKNLAHVLEMAERLLGDRDAGLPAADRRRLFLCFACRGAYHGLIGGLGKNPVATRSAAVGGVPLTPIYLTTKSRL